MGFRNRNSFKRVIFSILIVGLGLPLVGCSSTSGSGTSASAPTPQNNPSRVPASISTSVQERDYFGLCIKERSESYCRKVTGKY